MGRRKTSRSNTAPRSAVVRGPEDSAPPEEAHLDLVAPEEARAPATEAAVEPAAVEVAAVAAVEGNNQRGV